MLYFNDLFINVPFAFFLIKCFLCPVIISIFDPHLANDDK